jgi:hypothetical protein
MTQSSQIARLPPEFDNFLFAPVGEDTNGMSLSVMSVLARSDLDPWQEAARLADLPEKYATARLATLIEALPGKPRVQAGYTTAAAHLVALLPRRTIANGASPAATTRSGAAPNSWAYVCMVLMVLALGAQWVAAGRPAAAKPEVANTPTTATVPPGDPPPNIGQ